MYSISMPDDSGNIIFRDQQVTSDGIEINLSIREDYINFQFQEAILPEHNNPRKRNFFQWFYFHCDSTLEIEALKGKKIRLNIVNAKDVFVPAWNKNYPYRTWARTDQQDWHRIGTIFNEETGILTFSMPCATHVEFAFYPPYPYAKHCELVNSTKKCKKTILGHSIEGKPINLLQYGEDRADKKVLFVIARQHPGETPAAFFIEGLIKHLETEDEPLLENAVIYIVDNMNPDGTYHGNLRANVAGIDLNRAWANPDPTLAPEVFCVKNFLDTLENRDIIFIDGHADEGHARLFVEGRTGNELNSKLDLLETKLIRSLKKIEPKIHKESCYPPDAPGEGNFNLAVTHMGQKHLAILIEQPFKEIGPNCDWTPDDCKRFGSNLPKAITDFFKPEKTLSSAKAGMFYKEPSPTRDSNHFVISEITASEPNIGGFN